MFYCRRVFSDFLFSFSHTDCELVALLEDDTGMELLVCNKIISLDLPVKEVYKKIWCPDHTEVRALLIHGEGNIVARAVHSFGGKHGSL